MNWRSVVMVQVCFVSVDFDGKKKNGMCEARARCTKGETLAILSFEPGVEALRRSGSGCGSGLRRLRKELGMGQIVNNQLLIQHQAEMAQTSAWKTVLWSPRV